LTEAGKATVSAGYEDSTPYFTRAWADLGTVPGQLRRNNQQKRERRPGSRNRRL